MGSRIFGVTYRALKSVPGIDRISKYLLLCLDPTSLDRETMSDQTPKTMRVRLSAAERRKQILSVAATLFAHRGFTGVTIKDIADACSINQAMLYRHFDSKEMLYLCVVEDKIKHLEINAFLEQLEPDLSICDLLKSLAFHILSIGSLDPEINRLLLFGTLQGSPEAGALFRAWRQPFVDFLQRELQECIDRGDVRPVDAHITARSFIGMVMDCSVSCFLWPEFGYEEFDPQRAVENNVGVFLRGLQP